MNRSAIRGIFVCATCCLLGWASPADALFQQIDPVSQLDPASTPKIEEQDYSFCGMTTARRRIDEYFDRVARFVEAPRDKNRLRSLIADHVVILDGDRSRSLPASVIVDAGSDLIPIEDWAEISRRGEPRLGSGGWRGCFLSNGKAFFEVDESGHLRLSSFNVSMAWDANARP